MKQILSDDYEVIERAFQRLMWTGQKQFAGLLAEHELTLAQFLVLAAIHQRGSGCPIGTLAENMHQSYPTMTGIVDRLMKAKLVERGDDPKDRRKVVISITRTGQQILNRAMTARREKMAGALSRFSANDRREFLRLLNTYLETLEKENV